MELIAVSLGGIAISVRLARGQVAIGERRSPWDAEVKLVAVGSRVAISVCVASLSNIYLRSRDTEVELIAMSACIAVSI